MGKALIWAVFIGQSCVKRDRIRHGAGPGVRDGGDQRNLRRSASGLFDKVFDNDILATGTFGANNVPGFSGQQVNLTSSNLGSAKAEGAGALL